MPGGERRCLISSMAFLSMVSASASYYMFVLNRHLACVTSSRGCYVTQYMLPNWRAKSMYMSTIDLGLRNFANLSVTNTCSSSYESLFVSNKSLSDTLFAVMSQSCQKEVEPMASRTRY